MTINYTTYDVRRSQETLKPHQSSVMVHSAEDEPGSHPFWYAHVLGVFHAEVWDGASSARPCRMEFLWVRWFGMEPKYRYGSHIAKLPKIGFVSETDSFAFGFLDPAKVIRASHLIPAFADGRTDSLLATKEPSAARSPGETDDWMNYYVNM